jgi:2,3-bisphosphoglycerate-dependent phosphoglycerate mutase
MAWYGMVPSLTSLMSSSVNAVMLKALLLFICLLSSCNGFSKLQRYQVHCTRCYNKISQVEDDGYSVSNRQIKGFLPNLFRKIKSRFQNQSPGMLILIRHGESEWNFNSTFTGWVDVDLNERGRREIEHAARLLLERGIKPDVTYTSRLKRAIHSTWIILKELNQVYRPVYKSWRLNERMYGRLEGLSKPGLALQLGKEIVQSYRSGLLARPPPMDSSHPYWHANERKYADLNPEQIPVTESLQDTMERTLPLWISRIEPALRSGRNVMIVAHGNSLRGIVKHIDNLDKDEIPKVGIPNGIPLIYKFDKNMKPIPNQNAVKPITGVFLEKKGLLREALNREDELAKNVPGYIKYENMSTSVFDKDSTLEMDPYLISLKKLAQEQKLLNLVSNNTVAAANNTSVNVDNYSKKYAPVSKHYYSDDLVLGKRSLFNFWRRTPRIIMNPKPINRDIVLQGTGALLMQSRNISMDLPILVIMRHGKTEHNKLGLFTGWEDAPLAAEGRDEARRAGKLLRRHGIEFDVCYTSWLSRAIETAWLVLDELDSLWLPIVKTWRLNERMYGELTGKSKKMIAQIYGEAQLKVWRRSFDTRPPPIGSFDSYYPGNDDRYVNYIKDVRFSFVESFLRSIASGRIELHRKFPKAESLKDCMERTIPYLAEEIIPKSIEEGKNVLIASSENAIRGLLMYLCEIPADKINQVEIPTGLPMIYLPDKKCIKLLDDGSGEDPFQKYNFGSAPEMLFTDRSSGNSSDTDCDPLIRLPN